MGSLGKEENLGIKQWSFGNVEDELWDVYKEWEGSCYRQKWRKGSIKNAIAHKQETCLASPCT